MTKYATWVVAAAAAVVLLGTTGPVQAQRVVAQGETVTETFTIEAIDYQGRIVTLKDSDGRLEEVVAGPEVLRFNELKVGDSVTFRYYESVVYAIRPEGAPAPKADADAKIERSTGARPGGTLSQELTTTVEVLAIDQKAPSITVKTDDGRTLAFRVEDKNNIQTVKVGDRVDITYTRGLAVSVESPK